MQEAIAYSNRPTTLNNNQKSVGPARFARGDDVRRMVRENAVIVFGRRGCCLSHVVKRLLQGLGANPAVYEMEEGCEDGVVGELREAGAGGGGAEQFPVVFIGGRWFGGLDRVMGMHITGELTPLLKEAGALWL